MIKRRWTREEYEQLMRLHAQGISYRSIARVLNRTELACREKVRYGMNREERALTPMRAFHLQRALPPEIWEWLERQVPEGSTLPETVAAIITDAYYEEKPK